MTLSTQTIQTASQSSIVHSEWKNESKWGFLGIGGRNKCTMNIRGDGKLTLSLVHQTWVDRIASLFIKNPNYKFNKLEHK